MSLTDAKCKNAKPTAKPYKLSDSSGLYLEVARTGGKYWRLKYRYNGKEKRLSLGSYPQTSLADAREASLQAKKLLAAGQDPGHVRKLTKQLIRHNADNTFEIVATEWHEHYKTGWAQRHADNILARLKKDAFPEIGNLPIASITAQNVLALIRQIEGRGAYDIARRTLQMIGQVFTYALGLGLVQQNPVFGLSKLLKPYQKGHFASLDVKELPEFLAALNCNEARLHLQTVLATRLLMLTLVRTSELIGARWEEIDLDEREWNIPAERMKMRRPHKVPLSRQACEYLSRQRELAGRSALVFPSISKPGKTMSEATILGAIKRLGYSGKMTGHGFRSLGMTTIKEKLGYPHEVVDRQLAHAKGKIAAAYDRSEFFDQRKLMLQDWADYVDQLMSNGKVVPFIKRKAA